MCSMNHPKHPIILSKSNHFNRKANPFISDQEFYMDTELENCNVIPKGVHEEFCVYGFDSLILSDSISHEKKRQVSV